jgi:serine/threonine protein kinase
VRLADFGLAKQIVGGDRQPLTSSVVTIWYRPPELLMGSEKYGHEVDVWSAGCLLYEMITRRVLFQSLTDNVAQELEAIFKIHGFPSPEIWKMWEQYPNCEVFSKYKGNKNSENDIPFSTFLEKTMPESGRSAKDLLMKMLDYDGSRRINLEDILNHPYLSENVEESMPNQLGKLVIHEMDCRGSKVGEKGGRMRLKVGRKKAEIRKPENIC